jgi:hypothetical protein
VPPTDDPAAITAAIRRPDRLRTTLLGALLVAVGHALVPTVLLAGYAARVIRTPDGDPDFDDLRSLAVDGARLAGVVAGYTLLPALLAFLGLSRSIGAGLAGIGGDAIGPAGIATGVEFAARRPVLAPRRLLGFGVLSPDPATVALLVAAAPLAVLTGYLGTVAAVRVARTGRLAAGFDSAVLATARRRATVAAWLRGALLVVAGGLVAAVLGLVPVVGWLAAAAVTFHASVAAARVMARGIDRHGMDPGAAPSAVGGETFDA